VRLKQYPVLYCYHCCCIVDLGYCCRILGCSKRSGVGNCCCCFVVQIPGGSLRGFLVVAGIVGVGVGIVVGTVAAVGIVEVVVGIVVVVVEVEEEVELLANDLLQL